MKIGIALGGGGARGYAHIGVLRELADAGIYPDVVAGTSIGAMVGAAYAADRLDRFEQAWNEVSVKDLPGLLTPRWPRDGLFSANRGMTLLDEVLGVKRFDQLRRPLATVAVDLMSGQRVVHTEGDIIPAVRASIAIPVVFSPVANDDQILVDGGVLEPLPITACRQLGADFVIGVSLFSDFRRPPRPSYELEDSLKSYANSPLLDWLGRFKGRSQSRLGMLETLSATLSLFQRELTRLQLEVTPGDYVFGPPVSHIGVLDFHKAKPLGDDARAHVRAQLPQLQKRLLQTKASRDSGT